MLLVCLRQCAQSPPHFPDSPNHWLMPFNCHGTLSWSFCGRGRFNYYVVKAEALRRKPSLLGGFLLFLSAGRCNAVDRSFLFLLLRLSWALCFYRCCRRACWCSFILLGTEPASLFSSSPITYLGQLELVFCICMNLPTSFSVFQLSAAQSCCRRTNHLVN